MVLWGETVLRGGLEEIKSKIVPDQWQLFRNTLQKIDGEGYLTEAYSDYIQSKGRSTYFLHSLFTVKDNLLNKLLSRDRVVVVAQQRFRVLEYEFEPSAVFFEGDFEKFRTILLGQQFWQQRATASYFLMEASHSGRVHRSWKPAGDESRGFESHRFRQ